MIRDIFHRVLTAKDAAIVRSALSSLAQFGHNLSSAHVRHLPTFLPKDRIPQFQARNQGMIWKNSQHTKVRCFNCTVRAHITWMELSLR